MTQKSRTVTHPPSRSSETRNLPGINMQQDPSVKVLCPTGLTVKQETVLCDPM